MYKIPASVISLLTALLTVLALAACGSTRTVTSQANVPAALPALQQLDALPAAQSPPVADSADRSASAINWVYSATAPLAQSPNATVSGTNLALLSSGGGMEWALYRVDDGGFELHEIKLTHQLVFGSPWLARADFATGSWEFTQLDGQELTYAPEDRYRSPAGHCYFAYISFDDTNLNVKDYKLLLDPGIEHKIEVFPTGAVNQSALVELDGRPAIVYHDSAAGRLVVAHATSSAPAHQDDWVVTELSDALLAGYMLDACTIDGRLAVAYTTGLFEKLNFAVFDQLGVSPAMPATHQELPTSGAVYYPKIRAGADNVYIAWDRGDPGDTDTDGVRTYINLAWAATDSLDSWSSHTVRGLTSAEAPEPSLALIGDRPALAYCVTPDFVPEYAWTPEQQPAAAADWTRITGSEPAVRHDVELAECLGRPLILFGDGVGLRCMQAATATPETNADFAYSIGDWGANNGSLRLAVQEDRPFWCAHGDSDGQSWNYLMIRRRMRPFVTQYDSQEFGYVLDSTQTDKFSAVSLAVIAGTPAACWVKQDAVSGDHLLKYFRVVYTGL
jgi:hypothetical protein